jgi:serine/threonine protein kinase/tetratricopeptide (TPR) repeat protein
MNEASVQEDLSVESLLGQIVDEFLERLNQGEQPDIDEYAQRYPQIATLLRQMLLTLQLMRLPASAIASSSAPPASAAPLAGCLGDYRIIREVGRGGMGMVYEAEQISLGRRVALKVLPFAAGMDAKQLQRFKNEAQAAAQLHHTNIVPVFGVGCERGVHFYAMQFIEGCTLADLIRELRPHSGPETSAPGSSLPVLSAGANELLSGYLPPARQPDGDGVPIRRSVPRATSAPPSAETTPAATAALSTEHSLKGAAYFRSVANLGVQAAEALEYAHQLGVIHRDIKPANLLLDVRDKLWVTDFGLAHCQAQAGITMTGDLVGTLRYMSPEQALARRGIIDHRTDIYSLGATLYELLTLRPPIPGHERQELLARLQLEEPVPPRRLNPGLPKDLETIVLKALAKEPAERYSTAQDMADDLRRFLEDRPIQARRPTLAQRLVKCARRHRRLVLGLAGMLVFAVVGLTMSTALIWREKSLKEEAYEAEAKQRKEADTKRLEAEANRREAEAKWQYARQAVDKMYLEADEWMVHGVQQERLQQFLHKALQFYEEFARDKSTQPQAQLAVSQAYQRVGEIQSRLGQHDKAEKAFRQAIALLEGLEPASRQRPENQFALVLNHKALFELACATSRLRDAETALRQALTLISRLADDSPQSPENQICLVECHCCRAELDYVAGRHKEAGQTFRHTLVLLKRLPANFPEVPVRALSARVYDSLGHWLSYTEQPQEAEEAFGRARDSLEQLLTLCPTAPQYRSKLANVHSKLGFLYGQAGQFQEAIKACQRAVALQEKLAREFPALPRHRGDLASYYNSLGVALSRAGQLAQAEKAYGQGVALLKQLTADFPTEPNYQLQLTAGHANLAGVYRETGRLKEAEVAYQQALDLDAKLAKEFPDRPDYRYSLGLHYRYLGHLLGNTGRFPKAEEALRQALAIYTKLAADFPSLPIDAKGKTPVQRKPANGLSVPGQLCLPGSVDSWTTDLLARLEAASALPIDYRSHVAVCHNDLGILLGSAGRLPEAEKEYRQARDLLEKIAAAFPDCSHYRLQWASCTRNLAGILSGPPRLKEKEQVLSQALTRQDQWLSDRPKELLYRGQWAATLADLALTLREQGKLSDAQQLLEKTVPRHLTLKVIPSQLDVRLQLQNGYVTLARVCVQLGKHKEAAQAAAELHRLSAERWQGLYEAADVLARCISLADKDAALSPTDRKAQMGIYTDRARKVLSQLRQRGKDDPQCQNALIWFVLNCPAPQLRDVKEALALAHQAVEEAPQKARNWITLGAAHYRAGEWQAAITAVEKSLKLQAKGTSFDWFLLAMAHWQLGSKEEARRCYDLAVEMPQSRNGALQRLGAEAAALLGLPPPANTSPLIVPDPLQAP